MLPRRLGLRSRRFGLKHMPERRSRQFIGRLVAGLTCPWGLSSPWVGPQCRWPIPKFPLARLQEKRRKHLIRGDTSGGGGIRTHERQEASVGFQDRGDHNVNAANTALTQSYRPDCRLCCPTFATDNGLQRLVMAWHGLPTDVRSVVMRLVDAEDDAP